jgi:hypothetical protein
MPDNLADKFEEMADAAPQRLALIGGFERVTFRELDARANKLAHHLATQGVGRDDVVGRVARNSVPFVVALIACFKLRAIPINVNYRYVAIELGSPGGLQDPAIAVPRRPHRAPAVGKGRPPMGRARRPNRSSHRRLRSTSFAGHQLDGSRHAVQHPFAHLVLVGPGRVAQ